MASTCGLNLSILPVAKITKFSESETALRYSLYTGLFNGVSKIVVSKVSGFDHQPLF